VPSRVKHFVRVKNASCSIAFAGNAGFPSGQPGPGSQPVTAKHSRTGSVMIPQKKKEREKRRFFLSFFFWEAPPDSLNQVERFTRFPLLVCDQICGSYVSGFV
jgi:hypothetical protein